MRSQQCQNVCVVCPCTHRDFAKRVRKGRNDARTLVIPTGVPLSTVTQCIVTRSQHSHTMVHSGHVQSHPGQMSEVLSMSCMCVCVEVCKV